VEHGHLDSNHAEKVQMPIPLALRIVNRMEAFDPRIGESTACHEIDLNRQGLLGGIEINGLIEPKSLKAQRSRKHVVWHHVPPHKMKGHHARAARRN
jgi:hypothetical protein